MERLGAVSVGPVALLGSTIRNRRFGENWNRKQSYMMALELSDRAAECAGFRR